MAASTPSADDEDDTPDWPTIIGAQNGLRILVIGLLTERFSKEADPDLAAGDWSMKYTDDLVATFSDLLRAKGDDETADATEGTVDSLMREALERLRRSRRAS